MADFTPGPWIVATSNSWRRIVREDMSPVITPCISRANGHTDLDASHADLALIAAAPDLYEALNDFVTSYEAIGSPLALNKEVERALDALAKARGEK